MANDLESKIGIMHAKTREKNGNGNGNGNHANPDTTISDEEGLQGILTRLGLNEPYHLSGLDIYFDVKAENPQRLLERLSSKVRKYGILADFTENQKRLCLYQSDGTSRGLIAKYGLKFVEPKKGAVPHAYEPSFLIQ